jgi:hypothetical protein
LTDYKQPLTLSLVCDDLERPLLNLINEASVKIELNPSQDFIDLMNQSNFTQRGKFSWAISLKENNENVYTFLKTYTKEFLPQTLISPMNYFFDFSDLLNTRISLLGAPYQRRNQDILVGGNFRDTLVQIEDFVIPRSVTLTDPQYINDLNRYKFLLFPGTSLEYEELNKKYAALGAVSLEIKNDMLWVRLLPMTALAELCDVIHLPKVRGVRQSISNYFPPRKILQVINELYPTWGENIFDEQSKDVFDLLEQAKSVVSVGYSANEPATVLICRGENVPAPFGSGLGKFKPNVTVSIPLKKALDLQKANPKINFLVHPALTDIVNMSKAKAYMGEKRLKPYQKEAVGLHLSTEIGYLQSSSPGMGKSVIQLVAMKAKSEKTENYRGMIICEANMRETWEEEAAKWFPEAEVFIIKTKDDALPLATALSQEKPVIVIASYAHTLLAHGERQTRHEEKVFINGLTYVKKLKYFKESPIPQLTVGSVLLDSKWDDLCADEAVIIRNGTSKQSSIMWDIRKNAKVATALTATPINKSPNDIGRLISWVRNDRNLFTGIPLDERYNTTTVKGAKDLFNTFGPLVFRRDTSEISDELPDSAQKVFLLKPSIAEKALATAAEKELKRCYLELVSALEELEELEKSGQADQEKLAEVKKNLRAANGAWVGGTQLARMATSDPQALLNSESVGAALLIAQGLVQEAMRNEPTKRIKLIEDINDRIARGEQVIVFTDFIDVAESLTEALQENGFNAKSYTGKNSSTRDRARKEFQDGNLDVLVCTKAAERGLTLHKASAIYHYDIPWTLERIIQRTGRGIRIGSENKKVDIIFLILEDTIEQRMASIIVDQGISSSLVMDHSRGVEIKNTEIATAMSGLMTTVAKTTDDKNVIAYGKLVLGI